MAHPPKIVNTAKRKLAFLHGKSNAHFIGMVHLNSQGDHADFITYTPSKTSFNLSANVAIKNGF
jgi:hypothetical protein